MKKLVFVIASVLMLIGCSERETPVPQKKTVNGITSVNNVQIGRFTYHSQNGTKIHCISRCKVKNNIKQ